MLVNPMNFGSQIIIEIIIDFCMDVYSKVGLYVTYIYNYAVQVNNLKQVNAVVTYTTLMGAALCGLMVVKQIVGTYGYGTEGDPDQDSMEIVFRLCKALGIMGANTWLFDELLKFSTAVGTDVTKIVSGTGNMPDMTNQLNIASSSFLLSIGSGVMCIGTLLFFISACVRAAELVLNKVLLPIFCVDMIKGNPERWNMFIFQYGIGFFSFIVQMFCYNVYLIMLMTLDMTDFKQFMVILGWLVLCIRSPKLLEKYIYATGTGKTVSQGASRIGQVIMMCVRG